MPRLTRIRTTVLDDLAEQQRYTPTRALLRQADRAEQLAAEVEADVAYPEDWIVFRITGFRPDMDEPRMVPGDALRADLSALVESLSDRAAASAGEHAPATLGLDDLAARWGVSRKTIERYRRQGLVARRVVGEDKRRRVAFTRRAVEAFERANAERLGVARGFDRLTPDERRSLVRRAERYRTRLGWTRNQIVGRLAVRTGRSRETVRKALEGAGGRVPAERRLRPEEGRWVFEAYRLGASPGELAQRAGVTRATIHRVVNARRLEMLRRLDLGIPSELETDGARAAMDEALASDATRAGLRVRVLLDADEWAREARHASPLARGVEHARALAYHGLRDRARRAAAAMDRSSPASAALDRAETDLRWAAMLKRTLVHSERALVLRTIEERLGRSFDEAGAARAAALHATAMAAAGGAVERYIPTRGGRLAAPVSLALGRALGGGGSESGGGAGVRASRGGGAPLVDWTGSVGAWQAWLDLPLGVVEGMAVLESGTRRVLEARYGLGPRAPMTLEEMERELGIGRRRAGWLVRRALRILARAPEVEDMSGGAEPGSG